MHKMTRPIGEAKSTTGSSREKDIKLLGQQIHERDHIILTQKNELAALSKTIKNLQTDDRTLKEIDNRWKEFQTFMQVAMETKLGVENRSLNYRYKSLLEASQSIEDVLRKTENDLADSRERESQAKDSLRNVQASAFRFEDQPQWSPDSDDAIRQQLTSLEKHAKTWCRVNCVKMLSLLGTLPANILHEWEAVLRYDAKIFALYDQHLPQLILQALLMDYIYGEIFANSFFFLPWRVQSQGVEEGKEAGADLTARRDQYEVMAGVLQEFTQGRKYLPGSKDAYMHVLKSDLQETWKRAIPGGAIF